MLFQPWLMTYLHIDNNGWYVYNISVIFCKEVIKINDPNIIQNS